MADDLREMSLVASVEAQAMAKPEDHYRLAIEVGGATVENEVPNTLMAYLGTRHLGINGISDGTIYTEAFRSLPGAKGPMYAEVDNYVRPDDGGSAPRVNLDSGDYFIIDLPDGTTLDISTDPGNGRNHIKMYDDNEYDILPLNEDGTLRPLTVWNGGVSRSTRRGTTPAGTETVEPDRPDEDE